MAIIKIETPTGIQQVEIEGDTPTQEEEQAIFNTFFADSEPTVADIDFANASMDEKRDYARQMRLAGLNPVTGDPLTEDAFISEYKEPGVDYQTGVDSVGGFSRLQFGRMDRADEKSNYLRTVVGDDGYRVDPLGRHILTQEGRTKLGLGEGRELAVDEEGLTFNDVKEFAGSAGLPILAGIGAGIAASGVGFFPGALIVGAATAGGKLLDEGIEAAEGLQMESPTDIARAAAYEAAFGAGGELAGRAISGIFGRLIKGPRGLTDATIEQTEALRAQAREIIEKGYRPTVAGATDESFRPILNRLQAVYEGVFPNQKAAQQNLDTVIAELRARGVVDESAINNLDAVVKNDIDNYYKTGDQKLADAQVRMDDAVRGEIDTIIRTLKDGKDIPQSLDEMIRMRKRVFDEDVDRLYTTVNGKLKNQKIIPTASIVAELDRLAEDTIADIGATKFAAQVKSLGPYATAQQLSRIRTGLTDASRNPALLNDVNVGALGALKSAVNKAFTDAETTLASMSTKGLDDAITEAGGPTILRPDGFEMSLSTGEAAEALNLLNRTNKFYAKNVKRFDNIVVQDIIKQARSGQMNMKFVFDKIIQEDNPEAFDQLMKAIRGAPTGRALGAETGIIDLAEGQRIVKQRTIGTKTVEQALRDVQDLPANNRTRMFVEAEARKIEQEAAELARIRGNGAEIADEVRQGLSKMYLQEQVKRSLIIDPATGQEIIDPIKLVANIRQKGTTVDKMLGKELKDVNDILTVLERGKANLAPSVLESLRSKPLGEALKDLQAAQAERAALDSDSLINTLRQTDNPEVIAQAVFKTPSSIKRAKAFLPPERMEQVKDAAMGKILKQIGATVDKDGRVMMTDDFVESFKSGSLGNKLSSVLRSYGNDTLDAMFGPGGADGLNAMADTMVRASNAPIKGKGGLAAPNIALGLGMFQLLGNLTTALPTAVMYAGLSRALRHPKVLKMMMASRKPNSVKEFLSGKFKTGDPIGQGFQVFWQIMSAAGAQGARGLIEQGREEVAPAARLSYQKAQPQIQQSANQLSQVAAQAGIPVPQVQPGQAGAAAQVSPILNPDPATQALAQALGRSNP